MLAASCSEYGLTDAPATVARSLDVHAATAVQTSGFHVRLVSAGQRDPNVDSVVRIVGRRRRQRHRKTCGST